MNNINTISPNNKFSEAQKKQLLIFIELLLEDTICPNLLKSIGLIMMAIGIAKGDCDLVRWLLTNEYVGINDAIIPKHFEFANKVGFGLAILVSEPVA